MISRNFLLATLAVTAVILHGSLYPYHFRVPPGAAGPVATLFHSWATPPTSYGDLVANFLLYTPLGFFGALTMRGGRRERLCVATLAGFVLSSGVEIAQFYDAGRVTNLSDVYLNTSGSALGALVAIALASTGRRFPETGLADNPIPALLLSAMLGFHLFPYVPTIDLHKYWRSLWPLIVAPRLPLNALLGYLSLWLTTGYLIGAIAGFRRSLWLLPLLIAFVFAGKILIESLVLSLPEVTGAALAVAVWSMVGRNRRAAAVVAGVVLCAAIVVLRLAPFHFQGPPRAFGWLPFGSFLGGSLSVNVMSFLEKFFLYGSLIWLSSEAGMSLRLATLVVAMLLLFTSIAETYLPNRSAEITDALMVVMIGLIMAPMRRQAR